MWTPSLTTSALKVRFVAAFDCHEVSANRYTGTTGGDSGEEHPAPPTAPSASSNAARTAWPMTLKPDGTVDDEFGPHPYLVVHTSDVLSENSDTDELDASK